METVRQPWPYHSGGGLCLLNCRKKPGANQEPADELAAEMPALCKVIREQVKMHLHMKQEMHKGPKAKESTAAP